MQSATALPNCATFPCINLVYVVSSGHFSALLASLYDACTARVELALAALAKLPAEQTRLFLGATPLPYNIRPMERLRLLAETGSTALMRQRAELLLNQLAEPYMSIAATTAAAASSTHSLSVPLSEPSITFMSMARPIRA